MKIQYVIMLDGPTDVDLSALAAQIDTCSGLTVRCVAQGRYAHTGWNANDVRTLKPDWTGDEARDFLDRNSIHNQMVDSNGGDTGCETLAILNDVSEENIPGCADETLKDDPLSQFWCSGRGSGQHTR